MGVLSGTNPNPNLTLTLTTLHGCPFRYFLGDDSDIQGPYLTEDVMAWYVDGSINDEHLVCRDGGSWVAPSEALGPAAAPEEGGGEAEWYLLDEEGGCVGPHSAAEMQVRIML
jgi:hypothetical protein